jgi:zinc protease
MRSFCLIMAAMATGLLMAACQPAKPVSFERGVTIPATGGTPAASASAGGLGEAEVTGSANAATPAEVAARLLDEPTRRVVRFTNGMTALLQQNKTAPVVSVRLYVRAGSVTEERFAGAGLSHIVEHLVAAAATGRRPQEENTRLLLQMGNDSNAYTQADQSSYYITTTAENWPLALELMVDITANSEFSRAQFDREYKVVQRELELNEAQADKIFYGQSLATRYIESPARFPVLGNKAAFQTLTFEDCQAYYKRMYVPDNMVLSIAGDMELDSAEARVLSQIRGLRRRPAPAIAIPPEPPVTGPRRSVAHADVAQARIQWAFPTTDIYGADVYANEVLTRILGGGDSSLLVRKLRDEKMLVADLRAVDTTPRYVAGQLGITARLAADKAPAAQEALWAVLEDLVAQGTGVTEEALARAKAQVNADYVFDHQTADQQAVHNADDYLIAGDIDFGAHYVKRIQAVTRDEVLAAARKYLRRDRMLTTLLLPLKAGDPFVATQSAATVPAGPVEVKKIVLPNGFTVLLSRNPAAPLACYNLYTLGGLLAEDESNNGIGAVMMNLMPRETETRAHGQIADYLDASGTALAGIAGSNTFQLSMACVKERAAEAFGLFTDVALHAKLSAEQLNEVRHAVLAVARSTSDEWSLEGYAIARGAFYASSPYKRMPEGNRGVIDTLTSAQVGAHYRQYFLNPQHMVLAISGDIDPAAAAKWVAPFAALPPQNPTLNTFTVIADPQRVVKPTDSASAVVVLAYPGVTSTSPDRFALTLLKTYLGGFSAPSGSLLHETLRSKGLVYTVKAHNITGPAGGMFLITALGEPQNAGAIADTIVGMIESVKQGNVPDARFEAAREQAITGEKLSRLTVADISSQQAVNELFGLGYDEETRFAGKIRGVTKEQMLRAAQGYLTEPTVVIMTPEAKGAGGE